MVELFPIGVAVRVSGGKYDRCLGVVVGSSPRSRDRPVVRLLFGVTPSHWAKEWR